jgi:hypothetical protein
MSDGIETSQTEVDLKVLVENFPVDNRDLERLEALLDRFNIFEATGFIRQELRHSDFLAFLLDPEANHGLGDAFVKSLLQRVLLTAGNVPISVTPEELEQWDLNRMEVRREWQYVDILLLDEDHELAVIIENKIDSGEHSGQLQRYLEVVGQHYRGWRIIAVFLTRGGDTPSHEYYLPVGYDLVCEVTGSLAEGLASGVSPSLKVCLEHYSDMLRRNIVVDSDVARLCRKIYQDHKRALDLIYEHRPDVQAENKDVLEELLENELRFERDSGGKNLIRFVVRDWDTPALLTSSGWTRSGRILLFEFWNNDDNLTLSLVVGPGPEETRQRLFSVARAHPDTFDEPWKATGAWYVIYIYEFLDGEMYEDADRIDREKQIRERWAGFLNEDLPRIDAALKEELWIWEPA